MLKPPLILTVSIDKASFEYFNALRQQHFPSARNYLDAHLTLFHALPNDDVVKDAVKATALDTVIFTLQVTEPVSIGKGVAFKIESTLLAQLHKKLQQQWLPVLTPQDRQKLWPHITVQNKVTPQEAKALLAELKISFKPISIMATGLQLWEYLNGPWRLTDAFYFQEINS
jgi:2'-5' RNA ligase